MSYFRDFPFIERDPNARSLSFYCRERHSSVNREILQELKKIACQERKSVRISLHPSPEADLHNMIICHPYSAYIRPHKHLSKAEAYQIIEGEVSIFIFDEAGEAVERFDMSPEKELVCRIEKGHYHTLVPTTDYVLFHENRTGPFLRENDSFFAPWSADPKEAAKVRDFIAALLSFRNGGRYDSLSI